MTQTEIAGRVMPWVQFIVQALRLICYKDNDQDCSAAKHSRVIVATIFCLIVAPVVLDWQIS